jgi:hypothetical protein
LKAGDYLKFTAINENEYNSKNLLQRGCWKIWMLQK